MGGSVNVVVRESNGKVTKMCRWTNSMTRWLYTPEFLNNPDEVLRKYIDAASESEYNHDEVTFSPDGYGLVVIDAVNKVILSHQDYTSFDQESGAKYCLNFQLRDTLDFKAKDSEIPFINIRRFDEKIEERNNAFKNFPIKLTSSKDEFDSMKNDYDFFMMGGIRGDNRILKMLEEENAGKWKKSKRLLHYQQVCEKLTDKPRTIDDWEFFLKTISNIKYFNMFAVSLGEYKVIDYRVSEEETLNQWNEYKKKLNELGFVLTEEDLKDWKIFVQDF